MGTSKTADGTRADPHATGTVGLGAVVGFASVARRLRSIVVDPVRAAWSGLPGVVPPTGVLLYGPPGAAAAELRSAAATELGGATTRLDLGSDDGVAVSGPRPFMVDGLDAAARPAPRSNELAARLFGATQITNDTPFTDRPVLLATSVAPWNLDPELFSAGRFDRLVFVPPPDWEWRTAALRHGAEARGIDLAAQLPQLVAATVGWAGADLDDLLDHLSAQSSADGSSKSRPSPLLEVVAGVVPRTGSWIGRARELVADGLADGLVDDLEAWLSRAP